MRTSSLRLLRYLAAFGVLTEEPPGQFGPAPSELSHAATSGELRRAAGSAL